MVAIPSSSCSGTYTQRGGYGVPSLLVAAPVHTLSVVVMVAIPSSSKYVFRFRWFRSGTYTQRGGYGVPSLLVAALVHTLSVLVMVDHPF